MTDILAALPFTDTMVQST